MSRTTGQILSLKQGKQEILNGGPWLMALPLNGGGCYPNHNANTPLFNDICTEWKPTEIDAAKVGDDVIVTVKGSYKEFEGSYKLTVNAAGKLSVSSAM